MAPWVSAKAKASRCSNHCTHKSYHRLYRSSSGTLTRRGILLPTLIQPACRLAVQRLRTLQEKKTAQAKAARRDIALLLEKEKIETARIKVENSTSARSPQCIRTLDPASVIHEDIYVELLELLELYCELLNSRFGLLDQKCVYHLHDTCLMTPYDAPLHLTVPVSQIPVSAKASAASYTLRHGQNSKVSTTQRRAFSRCITDGADS